MQTAMLATEQSVPYILGHAADELQRLIGQARFFDDLTEQVLRRAGLAPGMHVLDVGCGAGDVSFLAAAMVGSDGRVVGVDKSLQAITLASQRAARAGLTTVSFIQQDLLDFDSDQCFDALVGSRILMYFSDPAVLLRRLLRLVIPGGIIAFQEFDLNGVKSEPAVPLYDDAMTWIRQTFSRAGADVIVGWKLGRIFEEAGLPAPQLLQGAHIERGPTSGLYDQVAKVTRILLPMMVRTGVASADQVGIDTLAERLCAATVMRDATLIGPPLIGAWVHTQANEGGFL